MSAAAAAIPRMPARKVPYEPHEVEWQQIRQEDGYVRLPLSYGKVLRATSPLQQAILWHIIENTLGQRTAGVQRATVELSEGKLAKLTDTTRQGVSKALAGLEEMRVIRRSGSGRRFEYGVDMQQWRTVKPPPPRKLTRVPDEVEEADDDADQKPLVMKTNQPLVILPGSNSKPRPLSEVCQNAECELLRGQQKGEPKANGIANAPVNPPECKLQLQEERAKGLDEHSPAAQEAYTALAASLNGNRALRQHKFPTWPRLVSFADGVLTVGVTAEHLDWFRKYHDRHLAGALPKGISRIVFQEWVPEPLPSLRAASEPAEAKDDDLKTIRDWMLQFDVAGGVEDEDVIAVQLLTRLPLVPILAGAEKKLRGRPIATSGKFIDLVQDSRKAFLQKQQYRRASLWDRANKNQTVAH